MSSNGMSTHLPETRRIVIAWAIRFLIAFILSVAILAFFVSGAVSR